MEVKIGFEPMYNDFAGRPLRPLGHLTIFGRRGGI